MWWIEELAMLPLSLSRYIPRAQCRLPYQTWRARTAGQREHAHVTGDRWQKTCCHQTDRQTWPATTELVPMHLSVLSSYWCHEKEESNMTPSQMCANLQLTILSTEKAVLMRHVVNFKGFTFYVSDWMNCNSKGIYRQFSVSYFYRIHSLYNFQTSAKSQNQCLNRSESVSARISKWRLVQWDVNRGREYYCHQVTWWYHNVITK